MTRLIGGYASACLILEVLQEKTRPTRATPNKRIRKVFHSGFTVKHKCGYCITLLSTPAVETNARRLTMTYRGMRAKTEKHNAIREGDGTA